MLLVFADLSSGELDEAGKGILAEGQRLAAAVGVPWAAACFAGAPDAALDAMSPYGVPEVLELRGPPGLADAPGLQADTLAAAARRAGARIVLLAHTDAGACLAPAVAARLSAAVFTECVSFARDWAGLTVRRQAVGAQVVEQRIWTGAADCAARPGGAPVPPLVLTMHPRVLSTVVLSTMKPGAARRLALEAPDAGGDGLRIVESIPPDPATMDLSEAPVIFTAGLGCDRASFDLLCELAALVGASVGVTRPVHDLGWRGFDRMVGQTGKTVAPRLYVTFGISGSIHHVGGIGEARRIVCLNVDPKAPIFPNADEGFVADVSEVLPRLVERVREGRA